MDSAVLTLLVLAGAVVLFVTELVPLAVTAMGAAVALYLTGVLSAGEAFSGLVNPAVILFAGMFVVGQALFETGMAGRAGNLMVKIAGRSEKSLMLAVMLVAAAMSSVLSNTSTTAVLLPVTMGIAGAAGVSRSKLLMPLAFAAGLGGMITLVGTPPNIVVRSALEGAGLGTFGFFEFSWIGVPLTIAGIVYMLVIGHRLLPGGPACGGNADGVHGVGGAAGAPWRQWLSVIVFSGTIAAMLFERRWGIPLHVSAAVGALVLVATRVLSEKQAYEAIDWTTIFLFAGMLPLATALDRSGAGKLIANGIVGLVGREASPYVLTATMFIVVGTLTQFMSNTAAAALMAPLGIIIAKGLDADPRAVLMTVAVAASCAFATPVGSPPNTLVVGPGKYRFFDYVRVGVPLVLVMFLTSVLVIPVIWPFYR